MNNIHCCYPGPCFGVKKGITSDLTTLLAPAVRATAKRKDVS